MDLEYLITYAKNRIKEFPQHQEEIIDLVDLARCEIDDGESEDHEVELAISDIDLLVGEK